MGWRVHYCLWVEGLVCGEEGGDRVGWVRVGWVRVGWVWGGRHMGGDLLEEEEEEEGADKAETMKSVMRCEPRGKGGRVSVFWV